MAEIILVKYNEDVKIAAFVMSKYPFKSMHRKIEPE